MCAYFGGRRVPMRQEIFQLQTVRHQGPQEQELDGGRRGVRAVNETGGPEARRSAGALAIPVDTMWTWHNGGMLKSPAPQLRPPPPFYSLNSWRLICYFPLLSPSPSPSLGHLPGLLPLTAEAEGPAAPNQLPEETRCESSATCEGRGGRGGRNL